MNGLTPAYDISGRDVTWKRWAHGFRLPTEAEWEYACRAGSTTLYCSGNTENDLDDVARWTREQSSVVAVGMKQPNAWGLFDMHGNVWEWCWDWYGPYSGNRITDPDGADGGSKRVARGGSWGTRADHCRSANRGRHDPDSRYNINGQTSHKANVGFRVVILAGSRQP